MGADGRDAPGLHHHDAVGLFHGGQTVGHDQRRAIRAQPVDGGLHQPLTLGIQRRGRLVQQQHRRVAQDGAGDGDSSDDGDAEFDPRYDGDSSSDEWQPARKSEPAAPAPKAAAKPVAKPTKASGKASASAAYAMPLPTPKRADAAASADDPLLKAVCSKTKEQLEGLVKQAAGKGKDIPVPEGAFASKDDYAKAVWTSAKAEVPGAAEQPWPGCDSVAAEPAKPAAAKPKKESWEQMADMVFATQDKDSDGKLTRDEILQFVKGPGLQDEEEEGEEPISAAELEEMAQELFKELDRDKDESISFDEFYKAHYEDPPHAMDGLETHPDDEHIDLPAVDGMGALDDTVADDR